ncbi:MAG: hypothetical protein Q9159_007054 [Coniocarpon cinnabarinum]
MAEPEEQRSSLKACLKRTENVSELGGARTNNAGSRPRHLQVDPVDLGVGRRGPRCVDSKKRDDKPTGEPMLPSADAYRFDLWRTVRSIRTTERHSKQTPLTPKDGTQTLIVRKILEKSQLVGEVGAALLVTPNGSRVLRDLGFSFEKAQANRMTRWEVLDGLNLKTVASTDLEDAEQVYGAPVFTMHRADLHNELMRVAKSTSSDLPPVSLSAASKVKSADPSKQVVELDDGSCLHADLIVGADGLHSAVRSCVLDYHEEFKSRPSGISAFRFQIPTAQLYDNQHFRDLLKFKGRGSTVLVDTAELEIERHLVWYDCQEYAFRNRSSYVQDG